MNTCSNSHTERLFIGEASFRGVESLLDRHRDTHPSLPKSVVATELNTFGRTSQNCPSCDFETAMNLANLFLNQEEEPERVFCSDRCARIRSLQDRGVTIVLGFDGTKIHESTHPSVQNKRFKRVHWNCPHDRSDFREQTLPPIIFNFFKSCNQIQKKGDRVHVTLAQPSGQEEFYQGYVYNIRDAAKRNGYRLFAKRPFGSVRYPGYKHEMTGSTAAAAGARTQREFIFIKGKMPDDRAASYYNTGNYYGQKRQYYHRDTDDESTDYSTDEGE